MTPDSDSELEKPHCRQATLAAAALVCSAWRPVAYDALYTSPLMLQCRYSVTSRLLRTLKSNPAVASLIRSISARYISRQAWIANEVTRLERLLKLGDEAVSKALVRQRKNSGPKQSERELVGIIAERALERHEDGKWLRKSKKHNAASRACQDLFACVALVQPHLKRLSLFEFVSTNLAAGTAVLGARDALQNLEHLIIEPIWNPELEDRLASQIIPLVGPSLSHLEYTDTFAAFPQSTFPNLKTLRLSHQGQRTIGTLSPTPSELEHLTIGLCPDAPLLDALPSTIRSLALYGPQNRLAELATELSKRKKKGGLGELEKVRISVPSWVTQETPQQKEAKDVARGIAQEAGIEVSFETVR
ncbi:hypothetical protein RQP46_002769 [Phenoliferia psychrophenolica]